MSVLTSSVMPQTRCEIEHLDLRAVATTTTPRPPKAPERQAISIAQYHPELSSVIGPRPSYSMLLSSWDSSQKPLFHAACIYVPRPQIDELYITSNLLPPPIDSELPVILISKVQLLRDGSGRVAWVKWQKLRPPSNIPLPTGGSRYRDGILFCAQGDSSNGTGGLYYLSGNDPPQPVVTNYFGRDFNSVRDAVVARDGSLWFIDACDRLKSKFREEPRLPCHVYRYDPANGDLRVMADGLEQPHGIVFAPDEHTVYVSDTGPVRADDTTNLTSAGIIHAFDVVKRSGSPFLANRRVFACILTGNPMGIICDKNGNIYAGCAAGVEIWGAGGSILGVIEVPGGVASLSWGREDELFLCAEQRLWMMDVGGNVEER
ncbi:SMP-30/Gluconolactonase/LRE-like region domain-containing protein [Madurella fahalii]|uniref:SMP-30/Gluconolactonase/LRE-like region domain-containing protein n=1 Tax=Madurella fahalii TaxID=1157608 RepID=A0ABQ0GPB7_9PEZI